MTTPQRPPLLPGHGQQVADYLDGHGSGKVGDEIAAAALGQLREQSVDEFVRPVAPSPLWRAA